MTEPTNGRATQQQLYEAMTGLSEKIDGFRDWADLRFVTKAEFSPIQKIAYGAVGVGGTAVLVALLSLALK